MKPLRELWIALKYGPTIPFRALLALAASVYAVLGYFGPQPSPSSLQQVGTAFVLGTPWRLLWVVLFVGDALLLWWRIFDTHARPRWAAVSNIFTLALWTSITGGTVIVAKQVNPDLTGYVLLCAMSLLTLVRTELNPHDRETA